MSPCAVGLGLLVIISVLSPTTPTTIDSTVLAWHEALYNGYPNCVNIDNFLLIFPLKSVVCFCIFTRQNQISNIMTNLYSICVRRPTLWQMLHSTSTSACKLYFPCRFATTVFTKCHSWHWNVFFVTHRTAGLPRSRLLWLRYRSAITFAWLITNHAWQLQVWKCFLVTAMNIHTDFSENIPSQSMFDLKKNFFFKLYIFFNIFI